MVCLHYILNSKMMLLLTIAICLQNNEGFISKYSNIHQSEALELKLDFPSQAVLTQPRLFFSFFLSEMPEKRTQPEAPQEAASAMISALTETTDRHLAEFQPYKIEEYLIKHHVMLESATGFISLIQMRGTLVAVF